MTFSDIKKKIKNALDRFYSENGEMVVHWKTSRSYVHPFAKTLQEEFDSWDVDCFFVHYRKTKPFAFLEDDDYGCIHMNDSVTCEECLTRKWCKACPDIIIHRRNSQDNLLVIQTELSCRNQNKKERDLLIIENYINESEDSYAYGLFINWAPSRNRVSLRWKSHSIIDREKAHKRDTIKEDGIYYFDTYRPYRIPRLKTETYIVGLIDILGTKKAINKANREIEFINTLNHNYLLLDHLKTFGMHNFFDKDDVIIRIYSDNIIFAHKSMCPSAPVFDYYLVRSYMAQYQLFLLSSGLLSRGFITQGSLFINDSFVMGAALTKVHEAEENIVKNPRVVVDPKLMRLLPDQIHQYPIPPDRFLKKDRVDGFYFLNYYQALIQDDGKIWHRCLSLATKTIINNLNNCSQETLPKLYWLVKYHNAFCKKYHCDKFIIPQEFIAKIQRIIRLLAKHN